jgi:AbrB family looped-hinge helix DNA binding protein
MNTTILSSKGLVTIPKAIRLAHRWNAGDRFLVEKVAGGVLLRPANFSKRPAVDEAGGSLNKNEAID